VVGPRAWRRVGHKQRCADQVTLPSAPRGNSARKEVADAATSAAQSTLLVDGYGLRWKGNSVVQQRASWVRLRLGRFLAPGPMSGVQVTRYDRVLHPRKFTQELIKRICLVVYLPAAYRRAVDVDKQKVVSIPSPDLEHDSLGARDVRRQDGKVLPHKSAFAVVPSRNCHALIAGAGDLALCQWGPRGPRVSLGAAMHSTNNAP